ncbi:MAG: hypothetical protein ACRCS9_13890 [Hyphomicrobium sp.]
MANGYPMQPWTVNGVLDGLGIGRARYTMTQKVLRLLAGGRVVEVAIMRKPGEREEDAAERLRDGISELLGLSNESTGTDRIAGARGYAADDLAHADG